MGMGWFSRILLAVPEIRVPGLVGGRNFWIPGSLTQTKTRYFGSIPLIDKFSDKQVEVILYNIIIYRLLRIIALKYAYKYVDYKLLDIRLS